ncbi:hypothetical protein [Veillonella caviae]|uniref:hypothetical protein n=1 Tax=Veillonella caviae TaxID=248316 RepID=UPI0013DEFCC3|nr:hypothetical protein [Veillonella caviae]MCI5709262.1 hypothetical protein [Veillonella caviae]MDY5715656.1 hypothetical protein [Veillonella caviae]
MTKRCFLCGRPMERVEGRLYDTCTNPKCIRHQPLRDVSSDDNKKSPTEDGKA